MHLLLLLAVLPLASAAPAPPAPKPTVILFVGNSFFHGAFEPVLHYNAAAVTDENHRELGQPRRPGQHDGAAWGGIPGIFKQLADEAGLRYEVHLEAISGQSLQTHYDSALAVIQQPRWDAVVLHDYSTGPVPTRHGGQPARFYTYATRLEQAVHQANPQARVYLYETWARADLTYPAGKSYSNLPLDSMQTDLHRAYYREAAQDQAIAGVAPAGDAWLRAIRENLADANPYDTAEPGKIDLWAVDHYHPSIYGAYLNACVLLAELTGYNPRRLGAREQAAAALGITPAVAGRLQKLAWQQVRAGHKVVR